MSDHATKSSPISAFLVPIVIAVLLGYMMGMANDGKSAAIVVAGVLFFGFGAFGLLRLARD
jgi:hypothetical protein